MQPSGGERPVALRGRWRQPVLLFLALFVVYNANGREIATYDSQPAKLTALAIARYYTSSLDTYVYVTPQLAERPGFAVDRQGHWRSAYPPAPGFVAGAVGSVLRTAGLWHPAAPLAGPFIAKFTASALTALAACFILLTAQRHTSSAGALMIAAGAALGTNLWAQTGQTLWQGETAIAALAIAVWMIDRPGGSIGTVAVAATALGIAGAARAQLAPAIAILAVAAVWRGGPRRLLGLLPLFLILLGTIALNYHWFGHALGARPELEAAATLAHGVAGPIGNPLAGAAGLLFSPSRGLLVFSPIALVALGGLLGWRRLPASLRWFAAAAGVQFVVYASYSAWWGGHSYGPRLILDVIPLLAPLAARGLPWWTASGPRRVLTTILLVWSVAVAATGAFVFPHERWNTLPVDVDRHHERLWDWRDPQFLRCWQAGPSPQNFQIFSVDAFRRQK